MRICNLNFSDYSNLSQRMAEAITAQGIQCDSYAIKPHAFGYGSQSKIIKANEITEIVRKYDVIQIMHSCSELMRFIPNIRGRRITVWHTGTNYRKGHLTINKAFNKIVRKSFYDSCEFETLGMKNPVYCLGCIDVSQFGFQYAKGRNFIFGHFPSNHLNKGTKEINEVMDELHGLVYNHSTLTTNYESNLNRIRNCDIYIEMMAPMQGDNVYGSFGLTALEAAAMGKVVITNLSNYKLYEQTYGNPCLVLCETKEELKEELLRLNEFSTADLRAMQLESFAWVKKYHDYRPTAERIIKELSEL